MDKVLFDYKIDLNVIKSDNETDLIKHDIYKLKNLFSGRIFIFFDYNNCKNRNYILLETGIIDYLLQFSNVIEEIDNGNYNPFSVSCDYFSNSLRYTYSKSTDILEIYEVNSALFTIRCKYKDFKKGYEKFRKKTLNELIIFYPELENNKAFIEYFL